MKQVGSALRPPSFSGSEPHRNRKVLEKIVAEELSQVCEAEGLLHPGQIGARKRRCAVDAVATIVQKVQHI